MSSFRKTATILIFLAVSLSALHPFTATAQSVEEFYRGKRIKLIIGSAGGGGYDAFARSMVRHLGRHIPGNPTFVVENMPGGGGLLSANYLYNIAPHDGLVIGMVERGRPLSRSSTRSLAVPSSISVNSTGSDRPLRRWAW